MMPRKNGYELCATLKTDLSTSHIPIILLTAKSGRDDKLEGLRTGADDYLAKPFDTLELKSRIHNLIQLRRRLREQFSTAIELKPSEVSANPVDQKFLQQIMDIVEAHLANEDFSVDELAKEIGMSRSSLNRKLRALVNQSTNQFIQSVRLNRAASLLRQQVGTVSEIAFQTGFRSTAYFVKCFKEKFGETPGKYTS
jgi:transcriptional regulator GlxA family with amidase domain